jgi:malate dehydrogenase
MKMLTAADIEAAGPRLVLGAGDRLTPLARDRAKELGVEIVGAEGMGVPAGARSGAARAQPAAAVVAPKPAPAPTAAPAPASAPAVRPAPAGAPAGSGTPFVLPPSGAMYRRNAIGPDKSLAPRPGARPIAAVVGAGHVGAMTALRLAESDLFSKVVLVDVVPGLAAGLALDMWHGAGLYGFASPLSGSEDLAALQGADYVVITAGKPRQPGMSRTDLTAVNAAIMQSVCQGVKTHAPGATVVVVSNPLEEMTHLAAIYTGFPQERVLGMAGVLDSARFCSLVGLTGKARPQDVQALALGSHGPEMVIPLSQAFAGGQPVESLLDAATLSAIVERTRESGGEIVKLLQKGSAYFSPAESAATMVRAMVRNRGEVLAVCVRSQGAYGIADTRVGLPVRLGPHGVREVVQLPLRPQELQALGEAASRIAQRIGELPVPA